MSDVNNGSPLSAEELAALATSENFDTKPKRLDLSKNWLDVSMDYPEPRFLLQYRGVGFSPLGGIQAITGHKKNGKTFLMCQLMAAILGSNKLGSLSLCRDAGVANPTVLYIDTEQEIENTMRVARRVHYLCGWDFKTPNTRFRILYLRKDVEPETRLAKLYQAIDEVKPTAVFLDGIRDVMHDINDMEESKMLLDRLANIADDGNMCIWATLHFNPGTEKMRGCLGTEFGNKVSDTLVCTKEKKGSSVTFKVTQVDARGKDIEDWEFYVDNSKVRFGVPVIVGSDNPNYNAEDAEKRDLDLMMRKALSMEPLSRTSLKEMLKSNESIGSDKAYKATVRAEDFGIIEKMSNGRLKYVGIRPPESIFPFEPPNDNDNNPF